MRYGSDLVVDLLRAAGIEHVALNPGATFRGLHDSLVNYGDRTPEHLLTTHEEIAVALAHGYAKAKGRPMAAIVHDIVGLQHASMAIFNAFCDRTPILVLGGGGPDGRDATAAVDRLDPHRARARHPGARLREARRSAGERQRDPGGDPPRLARGAHRAAGPGLRLSRRGAAGAAARSADRSARPARASSRPPRRTRIRGARRRRAPSRRGARAGHRRRVARSPAGSDRAARAASPSGSRRR